MLRTLDPTSIRLSSLLDMQLNVTVQLFLIIMQELHLEFWVSILDVRSRKLCLLFKRKSVAISGANTLNGGSIDQGNNLLDKI